MKRNLFAILFAAAMTAVSCIAEDCDTCPEEQDDKPQAQLTVKVSTGVDTKAGEYTAEQTYEEQVNDIQIFIFDSNGRLNAYQTVTGNKAVPITTTYGQKTVWAVVNGPDLKAVKTLDALTKHALDLNANSVTAGDGFVMTGSASVSVEAAEVAKEITVQRLTSRVAVCNITNNLPVAYANMVIESIVLANVVGNQNISGTAAIETWYNKMGRKDSSPQVQTEIIDGTTYAATYPTLTFAKPGATIANGGKHDETYLFYSYPNSTSTDVAGWTNPFSPRKTKLIVTASIEGVKYYYPVVLKDRLERNKAYTINMTITALGSTDPDKPVEKGTLTTTIKVADWATGAIYNEEI